MQPRVAIVGMGISGLAAAWGLRHSAHLTLFEENDYVGGHAHTVSISIEGQPVNVDTGFIVFNTLNYPHLTRFFTHLEVPVHNTSMSFSVQDKERDFEYASHILWGVFAQKCNLFRFSFWRFLNEIRLFNRKGQQFLKHDEAAKSNQSLGSFLRTHGFSTFFQDHYILPLGASIWSCSYQKLEQFSARQFLQFLNNHRLLSFYHQPQWKSVQGGSHVYVQKILEDLKAVVHLNDRVVRLERPQEDDLRPEATVRVHTSSGKCADFDHVILATPADKTLDLLENQGDVLPLEKSLLSVFTYARNTAVLHSDTDFMPCRPRAWASWNALKSLHPDQPVSLTYWMNSLQNLPTSMPVFVTLNPKIEPNPQRTWNSFAYNHPQFTQKTHEAQLRLSQLQNQRRTWFCGSYFGHGFHEDGLISGLKVAHRLGGDIPWLKEISLS